MCTGSLCSQKKWQISLLTGFQFEKAWQHLALHSQTLQCLSMRFTSSLPLGITMKIVVPCCSRHWKIASPAEHRQFYVATIRCQESGFLQAACKQQLFTVHKPGTAISPDTSSADQVEGCYGAAGCSQAAEAKTRARAVKVPGFLREASHAQGLKAVRGCSGHMKLFVLSRYLHIFVQHSHCALHEHPHGSVSFMHDQMATCFGPCSMRECFKL